MAIALKMRQHDHHEQIADMKTGGGGIESDVAGHLFAGERLTRTFGRVEDQTAPLELTVEVHRGYYTTRLRHHSVVALCNRDASPTPDTTRRLFAAGCCTENPSVPQPACTFTAGCSTET